MIFFIIFLKYLILMNVCINLHYTLIRFRIDETFNSSLLWNYIICPRSYFRIILAPKPLINRTYSLYLNLFKNLCYLALNLFRNFIIIVLFINKLTFYKFKM